VVLSLTKKKKSSDQNITEDGIDIDALTDLLRPKNGEDVISPPPIPKKQAVNIVCVVSNAINTFYKMSQSPKFSDESQALTLAFMELNVAVEMMGTYFSITPEDVREHISEAMESGDMIILRTEVGKDDSDLHSYQ
jgi:hypothetical protein